MSAWLTGLVTLIYVGIAVVHVKEGRGGMGLTFLAYALANVGLILAEKGR